MNILRYLKVNKDWLNYLESLNLDENLENRFVLQLNKIYILNKSNKLEDFLDLLTITVTLQNRLSAGSHESGSYSDFLLLKKKLILDYDFYYDKKPKEVKAQNETTIKPKSKINKVLPTKNVKDEIEPKIKLVKSNVFVYKKFYNTDSIYENLKKCNSNKIDWKKLDKDLLCTILMPMLNDMYLFTEDEFWETKKLQIYNRYLNKETFTNHFKNWVDFEYYLGVEKEKSKKTILYVNNVATKVNDSFITKVTEEEIKKMHMIHEAHWITEPRSFLCMAAIPVLKGMKNIQLNEDTFISQFNLVYNLKKVDSKNKPDHLNWYDVENRSKMKHTDLRTKFKNFNLFLKFLENGY